MIFIQSLIQSSHFRHLKPETVSRAEWIAVGGRAPEEEGCRVWLVG